MAITVECLRINRDGTGKIKTYTLKDANGAIREFTGQQIKTYIKSDAMHVINLKLTSDNRLIEADNTPETKPVYNKDEIECLLAKARITGTLRELSTRCKKPCYFIHLSDKKAILYIPDNITRPNAVDDHKIDEHDLIYEMYKLKFRGTLKVVGGKGLTSTAYLFYGRKYDELDISGLITSKVKNMTGMFEKASISNIIFGNLDTSRVETMERMFKHTVTDTPIDISKLKLDRLENVNRMFEDCIAPEIDITNIDKSKVRSFTFLFAGCKSSINGIEKLDVKNIETFSSMFRDYYNPKQVIDISRWNTHNAKSFNQMFSRCTASLINTTGIDMYHCENLQLSTETLFEYVNATLKNPPVRCMKYINTDNKDSVKIIN